MQLSASRWNQLMPINSPPRFVVFRYIKCQWDVSAGTLEVASGSISARDCEVHLHLDVDRQPRKRSVGSPMYFFQKCKLFFVQRNRGIYFCQLPCRNIAEEPVRITRPFRRPNERYELSNFIFFDWVSLSWMQPLAGSQNSSLRVTLGSRHRSDVIYENRAFPNCFRCIQQLSWDYFDIVL